MSRIPFTTAILRHCNRGAPTWKPSFVADLLGPAGGEEEIVDEPYVRDRYILGLLAPKGQSVIPEEQEDLAVDGGGHRRRRGGEPPTIRQLHFAALFPGPHFHRRRLSQSHPNQSLAGAGMKRLSSEELGL